MVFGTRRPTRLLASAVLLPLLGAAAHAQEAAQRAAAPPASAPASPPVEAQAPAPQATAPGPEAAETSPPKRPADIDATAALRQAIELYRKGDLAGGDRARAAINDPASLALTEWVAIRHAARVGFNRVVDFMRDHPTWPVSAMIRRRAEENLLMERKPAAVVRAYFAAQRPVSPSGKLALALAFKADGLERDAAALVRETWRRDSLGREFESRILASFPDVLTQADHRFRMERMLFKESWQSALRAAGHAGKDYVTLVKARMAVAGEGGNAVKLLDAVPASLRSDTSYVFSRAQHLRRKKNAAEAAKLIAGVPRDPAILGDGDEWWTERRLIARKLLDDGDAKTAYEVARDHAAETSALRIEAEFHAGWIALRFLNDATLAAGHFDAAAGIAETPISVARAAYWQGRAAEAAGQQEAAQRHYERAAQQAITYYGQLASAKLGRETLPLRSADGGPASREAFQNLTAVQALKLLNEAGVRDLAMPLYIDLAQRLGDAAQLHALGDFVLEQRDAKALLSVGKTAVQRGMPLDLHAFPTIGIPAYEPVGDRVEKAMVFAIARQESMFDPKAQSHAGARGLMQLMPATARRTAKRFGVDFDVNKLLSDAAYNAKIGAAHLGELMDDWKGSYILTFASYNAGGGNVKKWIDAYGDPRSPQVDPIDWVERIPFSETRNYVQRVMENLQVYRRRLSERSVLLIDSDLRGKRAVQ
ncbi:MAG TPA: lytic transglycosylase domain-containing protein [Beijerinckiaceae bacterium]|jgi:soluble lytic murein transglycosylase